MSIPTADALLEVRRRFAGCRAFHAGSLAADYEYERKGAWADGDVFVGSEASLYAMVQHLLDQGCSLDEKGERMWHWWLSKGVGRWHTNSMKLFSSTGLVINVIYKKVDGHPITSLAQVLESFDFGLLAVGWDLETDTRRDLRGYLFPGMDVNRLPLNPDKERAWLSGFLSKYGGPREAGRYVRYAMDYGYDLSLVKPTLVTGYERAAEYHAASPRADDRERALIYEKLAELIEWDAFDELKKLMSMLDFDSETLRIVEAVE